MIVVCFIFFIGLIGFGISFVLLYLNVTKYNVHIFLFYMTGIFLCCFIFLFILWCNISFHSLSNFISRVFSLVYFLNSHSLLHSASLCFNRKITEGMMIILMSQSVDSTSNYNTTDNYTLYLMVILYIQLYIFRSLHKSIKRMP